MRTVGGRGAWARGNGEEERVEKVANVEVEVEERFLFDNGLRRRQLIVAFCALVLCFTSCSQ